MCNIRIFYYNKGTRILESNKLYTRVYSLSLPIFIVMQHYLGANLYLESQFLTPRQNSIHLTKPTTTPFPTTNYDLIYNKSIVYNI